MLENELNFVNKYIKEFNDKKILGYLYVKKFKLEYKLNTKTNWELFKMIMKIRFILIIDVLIFLLKQKVKKILRYNKKIYE